jgi:Hyphally regulated cell wall protein N-terminal
MANNDYWQDSAANWDTPSDWSAGLPGATSDVVIESYGNPQVTASFGTVASIRIEYRASVSFIDAGASAVAGRVTVGSKTGGLYLDTGSGDGGSSLTIGERLTNHGTVQIGASDNTLSAASTIQAALLINSGAIDLYGSSTAQATLDVTSAAGFGTQGTLTGDVNLSGDALLEFKLGQITTIAGALSLTGSQAFVADAANTGSNSALKGLDTVTGELDLANGAAVKTSGDLANSGTITLDSSSGDGGSVLSIKGTLTNTGTINLDGDRNNHIDATLLSPGAFTNDGSVNLSNDFDRIAGAVSGTGTFNLSNGSALEFGAGVSSGETVTFGSGPDRLGLDVASLFDGTIDDFSHKGDAVVASTFAYGSTTFLYTQTGADSCSWTLTDGSNTAVLNFAGEPYAESDFSILPENGGRSAIVLTADIGPDNWTDGTANWNTPGDWSSGLPDSTSNVVISSGNPEVTARFGAVGSITISYSYASLTFIDAGANSVARAVTNSGSLELDPNGGDGGSSLKIGGALTNDDYLEIGNDTLSATSTLEAASIVNNGTIDVTGDRSNHIDAALLSVGAFTNDGSVNFSNDYDRIAGAVSGTGTFNLANGSALDFGAGVSSGETVTFGSGVDSLALDAASLFDGTIDGFSEKSDTVVAKTFALGSTTFVYTQTGADSCSWTLTDGSNTAVLNFTGEPYAESDFSIVSANGGLGSAIVLKTSIGPNYWEGGTANWDTPSDWSTGSRPGGQSDVVIDEGDPQVSASFGTVDSIDISSYYAGLTFVDAGASSVAGNVTNSGYYYGSGGLRLDPSTGDGGSSLKIGGALTNNGLLEIGPSDGTLSAKSTVRAASLANSGGTIDITGDDSASLAEPIAATLAIAGAAGFGVAGDVEGVVNLAHDGKIVFGSGQITTIDGGSDLTLNGKDAVVADVSDVGANSALRGLEVVKGGLALDNGAAVRTLGGLAVTSSGSITLDEPYGDGGSLLAVDGTLTNAGTIEIGPGNDTLSATSAVDAASVLNLGTIDAYGNRANHINATLRSDGAFTNDGSVNFYRDTDRIAGAVDGSGNFSLDRSTLEFGAGVSSGETVTFDTGVSGLILDQASSFYGTIDFFSKGDSVVARGFAEAQTLLTYTQTGANSCSWTLTDGANTATLNFAGEAYTKSDFSIVSAQGGAGLTIKFV